MVNLFCMPLILLGAHPTRLTVIDNAYQEF